MSCTFSYVLSGKCKWAGIWRSILGSGESLANLVLPPSLYILFKLLHKPVPLHHYLALSVEIERERYLWKSSSGVYINTSAYWNSYRYYSRSSKRYFFPLILYANCVLWENQVSRLTEMLKHKPIDRCSRW